MAAHPVRRSLQRDVVPYILSARYLRQQWFYRLNSIFGYTTDLVAGLAAIGVTTPFLVLLAAPSGGKQSAPAPTFSAAIDSVPHWFYIPAAMIVVAWIILRVAFNREEGQKRAVLAKSCAQVLRQAEANLHTVLSKPDPMPDLTELLEKKIRPTVDRNIQEGAWPYLPFAPDIDEDVRKEVEKICERYESDWKPVDQHAEDLQRVPSNHED